MPDYLLTHKEQVLRENYGYYCLESILSGEEAKPFEDFQSMVRV
jgi:hypothetical protein